jgi:hypothetical protein
MGTRLGVTKNLVSKVDGGNIIVIVEMMIAVGMKFFY